MVKLVCKRCGKDRFQKISVNPDKYLCMACRREVVQFVQETPEAPEVKATYGEWTLPEPYDPIEALDRSYLESSRSNDDDPYNDFDGGFDPHI